MKAQTKQLPKNWKVKPLSDYLDYEQPNPYIITTPIINNKTSTPVLTPNKSFIKGYTNETEGIYKNTPVIIFDDFTTDNKFVNFPFKVKSSAMKILKQKKDDGDLRFVFYQMQIKKVNHTTHKRYYLSTYQNLDFVFPPLPIQTQIVSAIETQFARLDKAIKSLKLVKQKIQLYRKAVLKKAFEKVNEKINLKDIARVIDIDHKMPSKVDDGVPFISPKDFYEPNGIDFNNVKNISEEDFDRLSRKCNPEKGDLLYSRIGTIGKVRKVPDKKFLISYSLCLIKPDDKKERDYLFWVLQTPDLFHHAHKSKKSIGVPDLGLTEIRSFKIPYTKDFQIKQKIVSTIESKFSVIDKVEQAVNQSLTKAEQFRKSILKIAFEGRLVK